MVEQAFKWVVKAAQFHTASDLQASRGCDHWHDANDQAVLKQLAKDNDQRAAL